MEPQRVNPIEGALNFMSTLASGGFEEAGKDCFNDQILDNEKGNITVDTVCAPDTNIWETGIERLGIEGKWVIVEQYPDREEAEKGHQKWLELMKSQSDAPLKDIDMWSLGL